MQKVPFAIIVKSRSSNVLRYINILFYTPDHAIWERITVYNLHTAMMPDTVSVVAMMELCVYLERYEMKEKKQHEKWKKK